MRAGKAHGLSSPLLDRLKLDEKRVEAMARSVEEVAALPDPVGRELARWTRPNGLDIARVATPIGVIGMIYESLPNVTADAGALCLKSGNAVILRGGSESLHSSRAIASAMADGLREAHLPGLPAGSYTFEVQANAGQGDWDPMAARLAFTIRPAWWRTWWFELAAVAAAAFLAQQLWAWRLRNILRRQRELETAVADRTADLERQKQEIERLFVESQQAARLKEEFLANMNHELRTPMNGIIGMTDLALGTSLTEEQREYLQTLRTSSGSLLGIIDDILDFSNIEAGRLDLETVAFDVRDVVDRAAGNLAARARQKDLEMFQGIDRSVPPRLVGDPVRLRQVLINLLSNAVKFTEKGRVSVHVGLEENEPEDRPLLHFEVADTGLGICREKLSLIFEPFSQADGSLTRLYGGTGLGLTICARFVEMMGGRIWVESEPGHGSRFHFTARFQCVSAG